MFSLTFQVKNLYTGWRKYKSNDEYKFITTNNMITANKDDLELIHGGELTDSRSWWVLKTDGSAPSFAARGIRVTTFDWTKMRSLCHYTECVTKDNKVCKFPFRYKGRLYNKCITLDSESAWCSLKTDQNNNHIDGTGNIGFCADTCEIQNCPLGFSFMMGSCYHMSAKVNNDRVSDVTEAEEICLGFGSRLYQPRDYALSEALSEVEEKFLKPRDRHFRYHNNIQNTWVSLGAFSTNVKDSKPKLHYNDLSRAYYLESVIEDQGSLTSITIADLSSHTDKACIMMDKDGKIVAEKCDTEYGYTNPLGYACEARIITTHTDDKKVCNLPFKVDGSDLLYHSCIYNETERFSWCPTKLDENKFGLDKEHCPDEREIAYKGPGSGKMCIFPFLYDRVWYETCTKESQDEIWCPTKITPSLMFDENVDEYGFCTKHLSVSSGACAVNYDSVGGKCIRVSPFPETFEAAAAKCVKEGATLLSIHDDSLMPFVSKYINEQESTKIQYLPKYSPDLSEFWVGGIVSNQFWTWIGSGKNFTVYSNWKGGKENEGCVQYFCTDNNRLAVVRKENYKWKAADKSVEKPYICESVCPAGFAWNMGAKKCLHIQNMEEVSLGQAILKCSKLGGHLFGFSECEQVDGLVSSISTPGEASSYKIGIFHEGLADYNGRRITKTTKDARPTIRANGYSAIKHCASIADSSGTAPEVGILNIADDGTPSVTYEGIDTDTLHFYVCEANLAWKCPDGYMVFNEDCYKIYNISLTYIEAMYECMKDKGNLLELETDFHKLFIVQILLEKSIASSVWANYRKDPPGMTDSPDKIFNSLTLQETTLSISGGNFQII